MEEPEPSYAYLLEKNKRRTCNADIRYCTYDEHGNPIPFCFQYPKDKSCVRNTIPPNILFMGCYDDPTCGGHPLGSGLSPHNTPPYAYTQDGKCQPSVLCDWLTDKIAVPACLKNSRENCSTTLVGCYTEKTCGGNVVPITIPKPSSPNVPIKPYNQPPVPTQKKKNNKHKLNYTILIVSGSVLAMIVVLLLLFWWKKQKKSRRSSHQQFTKQQIPIITRKSSQF
jgi:hypothetical protein